MTTAPIAAPIRRSRAKGLARRETIMDAAEAVFAERGYHGSSLREIAGRCGAAIGLVTHHFASKEALFVAVVDRRRDALAVLVRASLDAATVDGHADVRAIVAAFVAPFLHAVSHEGAGLAAYVRLTSQGMSAYGTPGITPALASLKPISDLFRDALGRALPHAADDRIATALYLIEAALIFIVQDRGFLRSVTEGRLDPARLEALAGPAADFFVAGVAALAGGVTPDGHAPPAPPATPPG